MGFLILALPILEVMLIYKFCEVYSFSDYLLFSFATGLLGIAIMSIQGRSTIQDIQVRLARGEIPKQRILHRGLILLGGLFLFLPGILTDVIGVLLILPGSRHILAFFLRAAVIRKIANGSFKVFTNNSFGFSSPEPRHERDAEVVEVQVLESSSQTIE
jgi:UPF0716 protein FxsA